MDNESLNIPYELLQVEGQHTLLPDVPNQNERVVRSELGKWNNF